MSREVEARVSDIGGRYKSVAKPPVILQPCEHLVEKDGRLRKQFILIHGKAGGSTKLEKFKV